MIAKTADGIEFKLGMMLVMPNGEEIQTNEEDFKIVLLPFNNNTLTMVKRKSDGGHYEIRCTYSNHQARRERHMAALEGIKKEIDKQIEDIKNGINPTSYFYLSEQEYS